MHAFRELRCPAEMRTAAPDMAPAGPAPAPDVQVSSNALAVEPGVMLPAHAYITLSRPLHRMRALTRHAQLPAAAASACHDCRAFPRVCPRTVTIYTSQNGWGSKPLFPINNFPFQTRESSIHGQSSLYKLESRNSVDSSRRYRN